MRMLRSLLQALRALLLRRRLEREMREEMDSHLERSIERLQARGMGQAEAERAAHREFGSVDWIRENARDARGARWLETLVADAQYGVRQLMRSPLLSATMIGVLALGIGSNVALFSVIDAYVSRPGPGIAPDPSLVRVRGLMKMENGRTTTRESMSYAEFRAYEARRDVVAGAAAYVVHHMVASASADNSSGFGVAVHFVTPSYFRLLDVRPALGAGLPMSAVIDASAEVAVISDVVWRTQYGASEDVVGRTIRVDNRQLTIVGVAPPRFSGPSSYAGPNGVWVPAATLITLPGSGPALFTSTDSTVFDVIARLAPGVAADAATALLQPHAEAYRPEWLDEGHSGVDVVPLRVYNENDTNQVVINAIAGGAVCLLILLVTCTNVAGLQLGAALTRRREIAVRLSLGAGRARVVRQLLTESVIVALTAAVLALLVVRVLVAAFAAYPSDVDVVVNHRAALFAFGFALFTGIGFGLSPALHASRIALGDVLKDAAASVSAPRTRLQGGLVVAQVAFTQPLLLLVGAMLAMVAVQARSNATGSDLERLVHVRVSFTGSVPPAHAAPVLRDLPQVLSAIPGVAGAVPHHGYEAQLELRVHPDDQLRGTRTDMMRVKAPLVSPGYFQLMRIPLVRGEDVTEAPSVTHRLVGPVTREQRAQQQADDAELGVVIGDDLARTLWGSADPIGRRFVPAKAGPYESTVEYRVTGVLDHTAVGPSENGGTVRMFLENRMFPSAFLIRTNPPGSTLMPAVQRAVAEAAPDLAVTGIETLAMGAARDRRQAMQILALAGAGGVLALLLSAVGLFAIIARSVTMRLREVGIRTALGATPGAVTLLFFGRGVRLAAYGVALGLPLGIYGLHLATLGETDDPARTALLASPFVALVVLGVAALASWLPARRAARLNPVEVLRAD